MTIKNDCQDESTELTALDHLGGLLYFMQSLRPEDRCKAHGDAMDFYNEQRPDFQVEFDDAGFEMLVDEDGYKADGKNFVALKSDLAKARDLLSRLTGDDMLKHVSAVREAKAFLGEEK